MPSPPSDEQVQSVFDHLSVLSFMRGFPEGEKQLRFIARSVAKFASLEPKKHEILRPDGGEIVPIAWLVEEIGDSCEWFPAPIQMRVIYHQYWTALDKRDPGEMLDVINPNG